MAAKIPAAGVDLDGAITVNESSADVDFRVESDGDANMLFVDGGNNAVGVGTNAPALASGRGIVVHGGSSVARVELRNDTSGAADSDGMFLTYSGTDAFVGNREDGTTQFWMNGSEQARVTNGTLMIGCTTATPGVSNTTDGLSINTNGRLFSNAAANSFSQFATDGDGNILSFASAGTGEGQISISGSTTTYGAFTGTHWSRLADNSKPTILRGTLMESLDEMCDWYQAVADVAEVKYTAEDEEVKSGSKNVGDVKEAAYKKRVPITLPDGKAVGDAVTFTYEGETHTGVYEKETDIKHVKCKISDTADSKKIYGLFSHWDSGFNYLDDDVNDMNIAQVGTFVIRVNKDVTVSAGDLLVSNGDGTAKVLEGSTPITADVQSSIVAKVNSNIKVETYGDGSYTVPCTLHC